MLEANSYQWEGTSKMYLNNWSSATAIFNAFNDNSATVKHTIIFDSNTSNEYHALFVKKEKYNTFKVKFIKFDSNMAIKNTLLDEKIVSVTLVNGEGLAAFLTKAYFLAFNEKINTN